jgi:hypothetical protein
MNSVAEMTNSSNLKSANLMAVNPVARLRIRRNALKHACISDGLAQCSAMVDRVPVVLTIVH